jgi:hypothetical protein
MNHGQLLVDHPDEVAKRITDLISEEQEQFKPIRFDQ